MQVESEISSVMQVGVAGMPRWLMLSKIAPKKPLDFHYVSDGLKPPACDH